MITHDPKIPLIDLRVVVNDVLDEFDEFDIIDCDATRSDKGTASNNDVCVICKKKVTSRMHSVQCQNCESIYHQRCIKMSPATYKNIKETDEEWVCSNCAPQSNKNDNVEGSGKRLKWGDMNEEKIVSAIDEIYEKVTTWKANLFEVPKGKAGKDFIVEATRLLGLINNDTQWEPLAVNIFMIFFPLMLQKPSARSKSKDHARYLLKRLKWWKDGCLKEIMSEAEEIQRRIITSKQKKEESTTRGFTRLMMEGKVKQALRLVDSDNVITGVHEVNEQVRNALQEKHPEGQEANPEILIDGDIPRVEEVIFENIDAQAIQDAAKSTFGSGGPTKVDAQIWKGILCSKAFGRLSDELAHEVALLARRICVKHIEHNKINFLLDCRLVALMKEDNGIRPVGIGETIRRIIGKSIAKIARKDIQSSGGALQTCTGVEAGIEAAIHAMAEKWNGSECEAAILVDAENAFNCLNREAALHNIGRRCPIINRYLRNTYSSASKLHLGDGTFILSQEGVTQGDNLAMGIYAISTRGMIDDLLTTEPDVFQVWFADDSSGAGSLESLKRWWDRLNAIGPLYGYYPKASKTYLIVKDSRMLEKAKEIFAGEGVKLTAEGHRHIGASLGSEDFKSRYVRGKVKNWVEDVEALATIAKEEPQSALSAFNIGLSQRWTFVQRTVPCIGEYFKPLEDVIRGKFIPAMIGREVTENERRLLALPYRHGGLGIRNPVITSDIEYRISKEVTSELTSLIVRQETDLSNMDNDKVKKKKNEMKLEKEKWYTDEGKEITKNMDEEGKKLVECAKERGASSWLSALPLKKLGYTLNKQEFRDAIHLRYGWKIPETPNHCGCGDLNSFDHILTCPKGGYVIMRHNALRDVEAKLLREVCKDVRVEPGLLPTEEKSGNVAEGARSDVSARGLWSDYQKTFMDVRVTHPTAASQMNKPLTQIYKDHEREKKALYNDRVINTEKSSFTPLIFTTTGGMGPECVRMNKRIAERISLKRGELYSDVMRHIRTRLRFALLRCTVIAVRGIRGSMKEKAEEELSEISFNLIPQGKEM